jgi:shikimate dehydrogenase
MTTKFCVVGKPIHHSLSPLLHSAAYKHLGWNFSYEAHEIGSGDLASFLAVNSFAGLSVTMPLKEEAFNLSVVKSPEALVTGVANTLFAQEGGWGCANTDVYGLSKALSFLPSPEKTIILGSGATSASAITSIAGLFPNTHLEIMARNEAAALERAAYAATLGISASSSGVDLERVLGAELTLCLVPSDASFDLWDQMKQSKAKPSGWLFDASYNPWPSESAIAWGSQRVVSGIEMLIWQAIEQVRIFGSGMGMGSEINQERLYSVMKTAVSH